MKINRSQFSSSWQKHVTDTWSTRTLTKVTSLEHIEQDLFYPEPSELVLISALHVWQVQKLSDFSFRHSSGEARSDPETGPDPVRWPWSDNQPIKSLNTKTFLKKAKLSKKKTLHFRNQNKIPPKKKQNKNELFWKTKETSLIGWRQMMEFFQMFLQCPHTNYIFMISTE